MPSSSQQSGSPKADSAYRAGIWILALASATQVGLVCSGMLKRSAHDAESRLAWEQSMERKLASHPTEADPSFPPIATSPLANFPAAHPDLAPRSIDDILNSEISSQNKTAASTPPLQSPPDLDPPAIGKKPESLKSEVLSSGNKQVDRLVVDAKCALISGDMRQAILKLEEANRIMPDAPQVIFHLAQAFEVLRNFPKAREYYLKVFQMREAAGQFFARAQRKIELGFDETTNIRGQIGFGTIREFRDPDRSAGERVVLTIPVLLKPGVTISPDDIYLPIQFYDIVNSKTIALTRAEEPSFRWTSEPVDWADGEETLEVRYYLPPPTNTEILAFGDLRYYGYTAKLYYKGEPMDYQGNPKALVLQELKIRQNADTSAPRAGDDGLLPPIEAEPMSSQLSHE